MQHLATCLFHLAMDHKMSCGLNAFYKIILIDTYFIEMACG